MPAKLTNAGYAAPLRRAAAAQHRIVALHDWSDDPRRRRWFDADTFPLGMVVARGRTGVAHERVEVTSSGEAFSLLQGDLGEPSGTAEWSLVPPGVGRILRRLRAEHPPLETVLGRRPFMGVKTGDNAAFFLEVMATAEDHVVTSDGVAIPSDALCRSVRGRDLVRWRDSGSRWMLWPPPGGWREVPPWLAAHAAARGVTPGDLRLAFVRPEHVGIKVAWKDLGRRLTATVLPDVVCTAGWTLPLVPNQTLYAIDAVSLGEAYALVAILNSTVAGALLLAVAERAKDGHYRYFGGTVAAMPLPDFRPALENLARLARRSPPGSAAGREIEAAVARLYGVGAQELDALAGFVARRLDAGGASA